MVHRHPRRSARPGQSFAFVAVLVTSLAVLLALATSAAAAGLGGEDGRPASKSATDRAASPALGAEERAELVALLEEILRGPGAEPARRESAPADARAEGTKEKGAKAKAAYGKAAKKAPPGYEAYWALEHRLTKTPSGWDVLVPEMRLRFAEPATTPEARGRMFYLLSWGAGAEAPRALADELWAERRELFSDDHLVAFAESGWERFEEAVLARAARPGAGVLPAAYAALRGRDAGRDALAAAVERARFDASGCSEALVAAAALDALGEKEMFRAAQSKLHDAVLAALDVGDLERARELTLRAEYLYDAVGGPYGKFHLAFLDERMAQHCASRAEATASADQVFTLIEEITPR